VFARYGPAAQPFTDDDARFAAELAERASVALDRVALVAERERASRIVRAVFQASPLPIIAVDESLRLTFWNPASEEVFGWTSEEVIGKYPPYGLPEAPEAIPSSFANIAATHGTIEQNVTRRTKDGRVIEVHFHSAPLYDEGGRFLGAIGIAEDVTTRRHAEKMRDAFIDVTAHELKTPITTIYLAVQMLRRRDAVLGDAVRWELFEDAFAETERLVHLVDDLVVLSRVERGTDFIVNEPLMLRHVARAVVDAETRRPGGVRAAFRVEGNHFPVRGEGVYVEQVISNLLRNAGKYGAPPYEVIVEMGTDGGTVRVLDRGNGFAADSSALFDLYFRDPTAVARASGAGIGLFVCSQLVGMMGGRIWAANRPDGGAEFGFFLPEFVDGHDAEKAEPENVAAES
jgi:PAS domain S-box-containing protein